MQIALESPFKGIEVPRGGGYIDVNTTNVGEIISKSLPFIFGAAGILLLVYLVTAGISMMVSRGDPKAMQAAQAKITNALIGFFLVVLAYIIVSLVGKILNIEVFGEIFG